MLSLLSPNPSTTTKLTRSLLLLGCSLLTLSPTVYGALRYIDKTISPSSTDNYIPIGDPLKKFRAAYMVVRETTGVAGKLLGAQHAQLILEPEVTDTGDSGDSTNTAC